MWLKQHQSIKMFVISIHSYLQYLSPPQKKDSDKSVVKYDKWSWVSGMCGGVVIRLDPPRGGLPGEPGGGQCCAHQGSCLPGRGPGPHSLWQVVWTQAGQRWVGRQSQWRAGLTRGLSQIFLPRIIHLTEIDLWFILIKQHTFGLIRNNYIGSSKCLSN